jgi:hypothetical protein
MVNVDPATRTFPMRPSLAPATFGMVTTPLRLAKLFPENSSSDGLFVRGQT